MLKGTSINTTLCYQVMTCTVITNQVAEHLFYCRLSEKCLWGGGSFSPTYSKSCVWRHPLSHLGWMSWQMRACIDGKQLKKKKNTREDRCVACESHCPGAKELPLRPRVLYETCFDVPRGWRGEKCTGGTWKWELRVHWPQSQPSCFQSCFHPMPIVGVVKDK